MLTLLTLASMFDKKTWGTNKNCQGNASIILIYNWTKLTNLNKLFD